MMDVEEKNGERIAKVMARAGLCSRREAERWIEAGRVVLNGKTLTTAAVTVTEKDDIQVDGKTLPMKEPRRLWRYHKPAGLVVSHRDEKGRRSVFDDLREKLPRVVSVGRLDINTEGLLLLTNDGELERQLELPATGWVRRYRVRVHGRVDVTALEKLKNGITIDGASYGPVTAKLDSTQGSNSWLTVSLREGKNREIKRICEHLGLKVSRLIRTSFGPFQLGDMKPGMVQEVAGSVLAEQLGRGDGKRPPRKHAHRRRKT